MGTTSFISIFPYLAIIFVFYEVFQYFTSPLRKIPGPFIAKFTNLWRLYITYEGRPELRQRQLHEQYGPVIRIGPNCVSLSDPALIRTIYDARGNFLKSEYSSVNDVKAGRVIIENIFSTRSNHYHSAQQRLLHKHYTISSVKEFEPLIDKTIVNFQRRLEQEFVDGGNAGRVCKMDEWLLFFAWDVIGQITFSQPMGFLDKGGDIDDMLKTSEKAIDYFALICQMPWLDQLLDKNPIKRIGPPSFGAAASFCANQAMNRAAGLDKYHSNKQKDFLDYFIDMKKLYPDQVDDNQIISFLLINIIAGSDTTASALRAIIYFVLRNPHIHKKLLTELDSCQFPQPLSYDNAIKLPYLTAVIQESMRMFPGVGLLLERIVPNPGLTLPDGTILKPGTIVGINPWVVHLDKTVFGQDAAAFVPERWLRGEGESEERFKSRIAGMKGLDLTFGAGKRSCIGKNISLLDIYKIVPMLFLRYDMQFVDPLKEWKIQNSWFVRQTDMDVRIRLRNT